MASVLIRRLTNERDLSVPSKPCPVRVAVYGNEVPRWRGESFHQRTCLLEGEFIAIVTLGNDLAKNLFAVNGAVEAGKVVLVRPEVPRGNLSARIASLPRYLIGTFPVTRNRRSSTLAGLSWIEIASMICPLGRPFVLKAWLFRIMRWLRG